MINVQIFKMSVCSNIILGIKLFDHVFLPQGAMTPGMPIFSPMMPYGSGLTPQPVQNTNSLSILEEQQRQQQQQQQAQQASTGIALSVRFMSPFFFIF